jgi:hypothetical protein
LFAKQGEKKMKKYYALSPRVLDQFTLRQMIVGVTLALLVAGAMGFATPVAAQGPQVVTLGEGNNQLRAAGDDGRLVVQVKNTETGTVRTTTYNSDGSTKTTVTSGGGSTSTCTGPSGQTIQCP